MLKLIALILVGAWLLTVSALAQDQDGEAVGEPMEQAPSEAPKRPFPRRLSNSFRISVRQLSYPTKSLASGPSRRASSRGSRD